jgi:hypothetical protein
MELNGGQPQPKRKAVVGKGTQKEEVDATHLSINFFFKEINNLMSSVVELFKAEFTAEEIQ